MTSELQTFGTTFAPTIVALAALTVTWAQGIWQRRATARQHAVAVREYRLALLDRRIGVLEAVTAVMARYQVEPGPHGDNNASLFDSFLEGQTVFNEDLARRLEKAWLDQVAYYNAWCALPRWGFPERAAAAPEVDKLRIALLADLNVLRRDLILASRIETPNDAAG